ncbi:MAG: hypothetical protein ACREXR_12640 [Gammaproteobacteria bacterium]
MIFDPPVYSLRDFERSHNLSFLRLHKLSALGLGPRTIIIDEKPFITREAAIEFRARIEEYASRHGGRIEL